MGGWRLFVDVGGPGPLRLTAAATRILKGGVIETFVHFAKNEVGRGNRVRNRLGDRKNALREKSVCALRRFGWGNLAINRLPGNARCCRAGHQFIQRRMEGGGSGSSGRKI